MQRVAILDCVARLLVSGECVAIARIVFFIINRNVSFTRANIFL